MHGWLVQVELYGVWFLEVAQHQLVFHNRITDLYIHARKHFSENNFKKTGVRQVFKKMADNW